MRVLARGYGDEPLDRIAVARRKNLVYIVNASQDSSALSDERAGVGFPSSCVFQFNEALFKALHDSWGRGDSNALKLLWGRAVRNEDGQLASRG